MPKLGEGKPRTEEQRRRQREASQKFYAENPERVKGWAKRWQTERNPDGWDAYVFARHGGTPPTRPRADVCEICAQPEAFRRRISYDHNHATGKFRGWICGSCNWVIGRAKDSPELLRKMADYLEMAEG